jgi:hypothetical protein
MGKRVLDAGVHLDVGTHCFFELDELFLLCLCSVLPFSGFGGAGDWRFGVDFGGARFGFGAGDWHFGVDFGGARYGFFCQDCRSAVRSFFGSEVVEFVLNGYGDLDVFGVGGRGSVHRWFRDP